MLWEVNISKTTRFLRKLMLLAIMKLRHAHPFQTPKQEYSACWLKRHFSHVMAIQTYTTILELDSTIASHSGLLGA